MHDTILQGMIAASQIEERRADAERDRLAAGATRGAKHDARRAVGELLVRAGDRLAGPAAPRRVPSHAA